MNNTKEKIQSLIDAAVGHLLSVLSDKYSAPSFETIVDITQSVVNKLGTQLIEIMVSAVDDIYYTRRDNHKVVLKNIKSRKMISSMGEINLKRRLYYDKNLGKYFFAVDELMNIEKNSRIEGGLKSKLVSDATLTSYGKASKLAGNVVSRQTVYNLCRKVCENDISPKHSGYKKLDKLFIEADEDHIHLKGGKSAEVKLIYVHEGRKKVCNGRTELINPKYFAAVCDGEDIWNDVADYVYFQYSVPQSAIRISGDGANWIKSGLAVFPGAKYTLDKFHVYKSVTDASGGNARFRRRVLDSIKNSDREHVFEIYTDKWKKEVGTIQRDRMYNSMTYLDKNFESIDLLSEYGCSAEGHVSHVLSARMSTRPMAWSVAGADKMAKLRSFYFNKGNFAALTWKREKTQEKIYNCVVDREAKSTDGTIPHGHILADDIIRESIMKILYPEPN